MTHANCPEGQMCENTDLTLTEAMTLAAHWLQNFIWTNFSEQDFVTALTTLVVVLTVGYTTCILAFQMIRTLVRLAYVLFCRHILGDKDLTF